MENCAPNPGEELPVETRRAHLAWLVEAGPKPSWAERRHALGLGPAPGVFVTPEWAVGLREAVAASRAARR